MTSIQNQGGEGRVPVQTDPIVIWNSWSGPVEIAGMRFEVRTKKMPDDRKVKVVHLLAAPQGTELYGIDESDVYITVAQLHLGEFRSRLREGSTKWLEQQRIWNFLHGVFVAAGIKTVLKAKPTPEQKHKEDMKTSASVEDFMSGLSGVYCFDAQDKRAVFRVKLSTSRFVGARQASLVELVSVDYEHPLGTYSRPGTFLYHSTLERECTPDFKGSHAGDCQKMWEFLTDIIANHRQMQSGAGMKHSSHRSTVVDYHGNA